MRTSGRGVVVCTAVETAQPAPRAARRRPPGSRTAIALTAVAAAVVAWGLIADAAGVGLGTANPPFFLTRIPAPDPHLLWIVAFIAAVAAAAWLGRSTVPRTGFLVGATGVALAARLALAASRDGVTAWYSVYGLDPEAANEYLPALPALDLGVGTFLDRFAELAPSLPIHPSAHPPGTLLLTDALGISTPEGFAALMIVAGVLAVPLTYVAARRLRMEEGRARGAALLLALSPAAMIYGVTSTDAMFATLGLGAAVLLVGGGAASRIAGMLALAVSSFFSWALLAIGAFAAVLIALREGVARALWVAAGAGVALLAFYGVLYAISGYDPIGFLASASEAYELGISRARPWGYWVLGSPVAFFVALGLPISWYAARALGIGNQIAVALAVIVAVAALLGFSKAETERIWLFMAPLACLAAAAIVPRERLPMVLILLGAQALVTELAMETVW